MIEIIREFRDDDDYQKLQDLADYLVDLIINLPETPQP